MPDRRTNLFSQLTRLFRSGPVVRRKVRQIDTRVATPDVRTGGSILLLSKTQTGNTYNSVVAGGQGYAVQERLARLQDFNEMDAYALPNTALDIYAHEAVAQDANGKTLHIHSDNPALKKSLEELFYDTLNVEFNLCPWVRNLCKYGDFFIYINVHPEYGVINTVPIPINEIVREEGFDPADPLAVRFRWVLAGNRELQNWEVAHFRLLGNDMYLPYGASMLDGARRIWRQMVLIEDAMLVYRITRSPERRVFYVDVGGIAPDEVSNYMEAAKMNIKSQPVIDNATGRVDQRYNPLSIEEDYWIPTRGTETATRIDTLKGGDNAAHVEDVEYIRRNLIAALKIPAAYLGFNDAIPGASGLAQVDIRFSRTVNMIQRMVVSELNKIAMIHLFTAGFRGDDLVNFELRLSNPSTIAQQQKLELMRTRFEIAGTVPENLMSERWVYRNIVGLNDQEILQVKRERLDDVRTQGALEAAGALSGGGGEGGGKEEEVGGAEEAPAGGPGLETAADDNRGQGDVITATGEPNAQVREGESPVKLAPGLKKSLYNRRRNVRRRSNGFPTIADKAVTGATAKPVVPESLREALEHILDDSQETELKEAPVSTEITVKPTIGRSEMRALKELERKFEGKLKVNSDDFVDEGRVKVLAESYKVDPAEESHDDPTEFELHVVDDRTE